MTRLTVLYRHPDDPAAFYRYYHEVHIPIAKKKMQGLKGWIVGKGESATPGDPLAYYMIVGLYTDTDSRAAMDAILESPKVKRLSLTSSTSQPEGPRSCSMTKPFCSPLACRNPSSSLSPSRSLMANLSLKLR